MGGVELCLIPFLSNIKIFRSDTQEIARIALIKSWKYYGKGKNNLSLASYCTGLIVCGVGRGN